MRKVTYKVATDNFKDQFEFASLNLNTLDEALTHQPNPYYIETVLTDCYEKTSEGAILSLLQRL